MKYISRTVWILSLVSLFTDTASEMLYPVMPIYLKSIGFSIVLIGFLEGFAEAVAGLSKGYFGKLSDDMARRVPFVQLGYSLSALSKPMLAFFVYPAWVFFARTVDRIGKGVRTGARDALLSDESTKENKAKVFGFHRSMDTFGAVVGPMLALVFLYFYPGRYTLLFYIAFLPGLMAVASSLMLKESTVTPPSQKMSFRFWSFLSYWKESSGAYKKIVSGLLMFALFNSSDVFLLLQAKEAGLGDTQVIGIYIFYNLIFAIFAFPLGSIADRVGLKKIFVFGLFLFSMVYLGMALRPEHALSYAFLFFLYGIYGAATEGISKAWISNIVTKEHTASAIGTYAGFQSLTAMAASTIAGIIWYKFGPSTLFSLSAAVTLLVAVYFTILVRSE